MLSRYHLSHIKTYNFFSQDKYN